MNQFTPYYAFEKTSTSLVLQRPVPKPRKSLNNNSLNIQNQSKNQFQEEDETDAEFKTNLNKILLNSSSLSQLMTPNIIPPPLPPRNTSVTLPSPIKDVCIKDQKNSKNLFDIDNTDNVNSFNIEKSLLITTDNTQMVKDSLTEVINKKSENNIINNVSQFDISTTKFLQKSINSNDNLNIKDLYTKSEDESFKEYVCFSGWVCISYVLQNHATKKLIDKKCLAIIRSNLLSFAENDETTATFFGPFDLYRCIYVGRDSENKNEVVIILREVNLILNSKNHPWNCLKFVPVDNLDYWLVFLAKVFVNCLNSQISLIENNLEKMDVCGKLWIKEGISGVWSEGWAKICNRKLSYWAYENKKMIDVDIRKIILIKKNLLPSDFCNQIENSSMGPILIVLEGSSLYLQGEWDFCTKNWFNYLSADLKCNSYLLEDNRLTNDDVPIIVDKCIRLVSTYGLYQPGIYRRNGSAAVAKDFLKEFRENPFNVSMELITDERINAIADVLRTFLRQLDKPLILDEFQENFYKIGLSSTESNSSQQKKNQCYRNLIQKFPKIYYSTLKKLLAHLQQVTTHSDKNLATVDNITKVFGPTVFNVNKCEEPISIKSYEKNSRQILVMRELLNNFDNIFETSEAEKHVISKLDKIQEKKNSKARAEGFLVPIHLFEKDNKCFNVQCDSSAQQVVSFKTEKFLLTSEILFCESYALFEVIKNGQLERRLSNDEVLRQIVLGRWLEWDDIASSCYLLLKKDIYPFDPQNAKPFADDIRIAEPGSKSFKSGQLKIEFGTQIVLYNKGMKIQNKWCVDEMLWFMGSENERKAPYPYSLTFLITKKDSTTCKYKNKFFGYCVTFQNENQRTQWLNSVILCKQEYLPTPLIQV